MSLINRNYRALVVDSNDPDQVGRVKVRVLGVMNDTPEDALPWASPAFPLLGGGEASGTISVPAAGALVWVFFEMGDPLFPVYFAQATGIRGGTPTPPSESRTAGEYPHNHVIKTDGGNIIEMDDTSGKARIKITSKNGHFLIDEEAEQITVTHTNGLTLTISDDVKIGNTGNVMKLINELLADTVLVGGVGLNEHYHVYQDNPGGPDVPRATGGPIVDATGAIPVPGVTPPPPAGAAMDASTAETSDTKAS